MSELQGSQQARPVFLRSPEPPAPTNVVAGDPGQPWRDAAAAEGGDGGSGRRQQRQQLTAAAAASGRGGSGRGRRRWRYQLTTAVDVEGGVTGFQKADAWVEPDFASQADLR